MAREYGRVWFSMFTDKDFCEQPVFDKWLYMCLLGQPGMNWAGVQYLAVRRLQKAMRDGAAEASEDAVRESLARLEARRYVYFDEDSGEVLVRSLMRVDELRKQPFVFISALRSLARVESPKLAAVLLSELDRIEQPVVRQGPLFDQLEQCRRSAVDHLKALVDSSASDPLPDPLPDPLGEGLADPLFPQVATTPPSPSFRGSGEGSGRPMGEGEGEGVISRSADGYVSKKDAHCARSDSEAKSAKADPIDPLIHDPSADPGDPTPHPLGPSAPHPGWAAIRAAGIDQRWPAAIRQTLALQAGEMLRAGTPADAVAAGLREWMTRRNVGPGLLAYLVGDAMKPNPTAAAYPVESKAAGWLRTATQLAALEDAHPPELPGNYL